MNRRKFLAFLAAGGVVTATGLWLPGQKLISIPTGYIFSSSNRSKYVYKTFYIER